MLLLKKALAVAALAALASPSAMAGLVGTTVDYSASANGTVQLLAAGPASAVVGAGYEFFACVGPAGNSCSTSGLSVGIDLSDAALTVSFAGSTFSSSGQFILDLSGFDVIINSVTLASSLALSRGSFGLDSFTGNSIRFVGTANSGYSGTNGASYTFNLSTTRLPEPASLALVGAALLAAGASLRRRRG